MRHARLVPSAVLAAALLTVALTAGCSQESQGGDTDPAQVDATEAPELGACRVLTPEDVSEPSNATRTVDCAEQHTAETFAIGDLPSEFDDAEYDDPDDEQALGEFAFRTCTDKFAGFLGADESTVLRTFVSWAWFRPSETAWGKGARWYRCDVVGGGDDSTSYRDLPQTAKGLLLGRPDDRWFVCVDGASVAEGTKVPCSDDHGWRAVTTIKLGEPGDEYPGDQLVEAQSRDYCSDSVNAWLGYPPSFEFGYTWFHQAEWDAGNRRSVCWAKTEQ